MEYRVHAVESGVQCVFVEDRPVLDRDFRERLQIDLVTAGEIIDHDHLMAATDQVPNDVGTYEPGPTGHCVTGHVNCVCLRFDEQDHPGTHRDAIACN